MFFKDSGIDLKDYKATIEEGDKANLDYFISKAIELNLRNSVFIDNTASPKIAETYKYFLKNNINVVTCNKIACADLI